MVFEPAQPGLNLSEIRIAAESSGQCRPSELLEETSGRFIAKFPGVKCLLDSVAYFGVGQVRRVPKGGLARLVGRVGSSPCNAAFGAVSSGTVPNAMVQRHNGPRLSGEENLAG